VTSLDGINGWSIQTLLRGENDSKQSDEIQAGIPVEQNNPDYLKAFVVNNCSFSKLVTKHYNVLLQFSTSRLIIIYDNVLLQFKTTVITI